MAEPKLKSAEAEKAIARLAKQMNPEIPKRKWRPATYAALICYLVEECGGSFPAPKKDKDGKPVAEERNKFRTYMEDSDFSFSSNMKKYLADRGILPKAEAEDEQKFE